MSFLLNSAKGSNTSIEHLSDGAIYIWNGANNSIVANSNVYTVFSAQTPSVETGFGTEVALAANRLIVRSKAGNTSVFSLETNSIIHRPNVNRRVSDYYNHSMATIGDKMIISSGEGVSNVYFLNNTYSSTLSFNAVVVSETSFNTAGFAVAAADNRIVIGMPRDLAGGQIRVFNYNGEKLFDVMSPGGGGLINYFGDVVSIGGGVIAVGVPYSDATGTFNAGAVDLFDYNGYFIKKILPPNITSNGNFGGALSVGSGILATIYLGRYGLDIRDLTGTLIADINLPYQPRSVKVKYGKIFVGIPELPIGTRSGRVYVYDLRGNLLQIIQPNTITNARFGASIDAGYGYLAVGANTNTVSGTSNAGSVLLYKLNPEYTIDDAAYITYNGD
jgi:hypothetical protein